MPRKRADLEKVTVRLRAGDFKALEDAYSSDITTNAVIRAIVSRHVDELRAKTNVPVLEITLD